MCAPVLNLEIANILKPEIGAPVGLTVHLTDLIVINLHLAQEWSKGESPVRLAPRTRRSRRRSGGGTGSAAHGAWAKLSTSKATLTLIESEKGLLERDLCYRTSQHVLHISEMICRKRLHR